MGLLRMPPMPQVPLVAEVQVRCPHASRLQVRVQAVATNTAMGADSDWSAPLMFTPTCEAKARNCF